MRVRIPASIEPTAHSDGWRVRYGFIGADGPFVSQRIAQAHADRYNRAHPPLERCPTCGGTGSVESVDHKAGK